MAENDVASPICRGKNLSWETVMLFFNYMPKVSMPKSQFNSFVEKNINGWTQTHSQIARQLAFYYEKDGICYPRFGELSTLSNLFEYLVHWAHNYFVPNPFTPSLKGNTPSSIYSHLVECIRNGNNDFDSALDSLFGFPLSSHDKVRVYLQNYTNIKFDSGRICLNDGLADETDIKTPTELAATNSIDYFFFFGNVDSVLKQNSKRVCSHYPLQQISYGPAPSSYTQYITAIKTKPFVLLAGISGTGKSRIVRQLARACDTIDENPWTVQKPANFEMIQVRPDWHDGSELLGYESRISGKGEYVVKEFVKFVVKAWIYEQEDVPFFLCLDEMNLAPVEQYFAEYLSVVETRKADKDGNITCDPLIKLNKEYCQSIANAIYPGSEGDAHDAEQLSNVENLMALLEGMDYCVPLPKNLIVMGTVNMDETTFGFSRKVLDRAMTIEMNEVDLAGGLEDGESERFGIAAADILPTAVEGKDVYAENKELCDKVIGYLQQVNDVLEDTPFKIAYRTRNEFLVYAVNRGEDNLTEALDEMTSMKILSRIEGDQDKVGQVLERLEQVMKDNGLAEDGLSRKKVKAMAQRLKSGYTSYWN